MRVVQALLACVVLVACDKKPTAQEARQQRAIQDAQRVAAINKPLAPRVLQAGTHELVVVEVPSATHKTLVSKQLCYVWRDAEFRTASISCPGDGSQLDLGDESNGRDLAADGEPARGGR